MKVYVLERGVYSDRYISGVYDTPDAAMAAAPGKWSHDADEHDERWLNDLDWGDAACVYAFEVERAEVDASA